MDLTAALIDQELCKIHDETQAAKLVSIAQALMVVWLVLQSVLLAITGCLGVPDVPVFIASIVVTTAPAAVAMGMLVAASLRNRALAMRPILCCCGIAVVGTVEALCVLELVA